MDFGTYIVGEFKGIAPDEGFGERLRVRVGEPTPRSKDGYEELVDFTPYRPEDGRRTLPNELRQGDYVALRVRVVTKGYVSDKRGLGGMAISTLLEVNILSHGGSPVELFRDGELLTYTRNDD